jgi:hypothetical protein
MAPSEEHGDAPAGDSPTDEGPTGEAPDPQSGAAPTSVPPAAPPASLEKRTLHEVVHLWIPLGIVLVSVCAAVSGWRASVSDESSAHTFELSRQALVQQQQLLIQDNQSVNTDIRLFGQFAQYSSLAHSLAQDADQVGGAVGDQLRIEAQADLELARSIGNQIKNQSYAFDPSNPTGNSYLRSDGSYLPGHPYNAGDALSFAESNDFALHGLAPEALHSTAETEHTRGVDFTGVAALFIAVLVLLTFAALSSGTQKLWFAGSGTALGGCALILFLVIQFS